MPNGFEPPKVVLSRQAEIPKLALAGSPVAAMGEGLSSLLTSVALSVPDMPGPGLPAAVGGGGLQLPDFLKGIQASLPAGFPQPPQLGGGPATIGPKVDNAKAPIGAFKIGL